ncbi:sterol carrier family protein [Gulosibacter bifidus]|uniref:Sterol carrier family protein n=1 Tax=Gulosibacter bifidus TaxID=272239 RepID=A0ABW5RJF0_9MICO|nr:sterol carrier family protein [Gulosibacter bifidus]
MRVRIDDAAGIAALSAWWQATREFESDELRTAETGAAAASPTARLPRATLATAVRYTLQRLTDLAPGKSVEVRVPPFGAVQCVEGPGHTRGTPPNVIEMDAATWLALAVGEMSWDAARSAGDGRVQASGVRADLTGLVPVLGLAERDRLR